MKVSKVNIKRARAKKRGAKERGASQVRIVVAKRSQVVLGGPFALLVSVVCLPRYPTSREDDDEVDIIPVLPQVEPISFLGPTIPIAIPRKTSTIVKQK